MIDLKLTTQEAIALDHALYFLVEGIFPQVQAEVLAGLKRNTELANARKKIRIELDNLSQTQQILQEENS